MRRGRPLSFRLSAYMLISLLFGTEVVFLVDFAASTMGYLRPKANPDDIAEPYTRRLVIESIVRASDGQLRIEPVAALRALAQRTPTLRFGALDKSTGAILSGSSEALARTLGSANSLHTHWMEFRFALPSEDREAAPGFLVQADTPYGALLIATYGFRFEWTILEALALDGLLDMVTWQGPVYVFAAFVIWFAVRRALAPLVSAAEKARNIDLDSLNEKLPDAAMPREVAPFVHAVNEALARVSDGVARQRRFVANAAHQLCTPIAILRARVDNPDDERLREDLRRDLRGLQMIVEQMLVSARLAEKGGEPREPLDFCALVREKIADYAPLMRENRRYVEFEGSAAPAMICGDRRALDSVVANLIDNALRAEPEDGTVVVRISEGPTLEIVDHGDGVAEADREMIFEPFWRKCDASPGTGLGLAIVKEIVAMHHGRICVETTPGGGATFRVTLSQARRAGGDHIANASDASGVRAPDGVAI